MNAQNLALGREHAWIAHLPGLPWVMNAVSNSPTRRFRAEEQAEAGVAIPDIVEPGSAI